jgi:hypothetical protein
MPADLQALTDPELAVDEEFLELMCADEELLRAEFDAIIAQEWASRPPPAEPPAASPGTGPDQQWRRVPPDVRGSRLRPRHPGIGGWSRQRSPPPVPGVPNQEFERSGRKVGGRPDTHDPSRRSNYPN